MQAMRMGSSYILLVWTGRVTYNANKGMRSLAHLRIKSAVALRHTAHARHLDDVLPQPHAPQRRPAVADAVQGEGVCL